MTLEGILTCVRFTHSWKALLPIALTEEWISIFFKLVQFLNADACIDVANEGISNSSSDEHSLKVPVLIDFIDVFSKITCFNDEHFENT